MSLKLHIIFETVPAQNGLKWSKRGQKCTKWSKFVIFCPSKTKVTCQNDVHDGSYLRPCSQQTTRLLDCITYSVALQMLTSSTLRINGTSGVTASRGVLLTYQEKRSKGKKKGKWRRIEKKRRKIVKRKVKIQNGRGKVSKWAEDSFFFFFFLLFSVLKQLKFVWGLSKWKFLAGKKHFTKPEWIIWLIWAIVGQYKDKMTQKCVTNESFCPCSDTLWLKMSQMIHSGFSVREKKSRKVTLLPLKNIPLMPLDGMLNVCTDFIREKEIMVCDSLYITSCPWLKWDEVYLFASSPVKFASVTSSSMSFNLPRYSSSIL